MNNPMLYTDPSGMSWFSDLWDWAKGNPLINPIAGLDWLNEKIAPSVNNFLDNNNISVNAGVGYSSGNGLYTYGGNQIFYHNQSGHDYEGTVNAAISKARELYFQSNPIANNIDWNRNVGTISQYEPGFFQKWSESSNIFLSMGYSLADAVNVVGQSLLFNASSANHLNGESVVGYDAVSGFSEIGSWVVGSHSAKSFIKTAYSFKSSFLNITKSAVSRNKNGALKFTSQIRFPKINLNIRFDRGFRAPFKNTTKNYLGKSYNGFNTHFNINFQWNGSTINWHLPLNPLKWKFYTIP